MTRKILAMGKLLPAEMEELDRNFDVIRLWKEADPESAIHENSRDIRAVLSTYNSPKVSRSLMEALPNLELIVQYGVGYDNIDIEAAKSYQITVTNTPDLVTEDTADIALSLMLCAARRIVEGDMYIRVGKWAGGNSQFPYGTSMADKTVGIAGMGRIGCAIAKRSEAFGMNVIYNGPGEKHDLDYQYFPDIKEMAASCDFLVVACPGGPETENLIDLEVLQSLGRSGFLINIARGSVVNEKDLLIALSSKYIAGAGLDVFKNEPNVPCELFSMDNVVLLPHIGTLTVETRSKMGQLCINNLMAYFEGKQVFTPV